MWRNALLAALLLAGLPQLSDARATLKVGLKGGYSVAAAAADDSDADAVDAGQDQGDPEPAVSKIGAVLNTLKAIYTSVQNEEKAETENYNKYVKWCEDELRTYGASLDQARTESEQSSLLNKELTASTIGLEQTLASIKAQIEQVQNTMEQAQTLRNEENQRYKQDIMLNEMSIKQLEQATQIVAKVHQKGGLIQQGALRRVQLNEPGESSYVVGVMRQMKERFQRAHEEIKASEAKKLGLFEKLMAAKKAELAALQTEQSQKKQMLTKDKVQLVEIKRRETQATQTIRDLTELKSQVTEQCAEKRRQWGVRKEDRAKEKEALQQAINVIAVSAGAGEAPKKAFMQEQQGPFALVQVAARVQNKAEVTALSGTAELMRSVANGLAYLVASSADDGRRKDGSFDAATKVVMKLIEVLKKQQQEEAKLKAYCQAELERKDLEQTKNIEEMKRIDATLTANAATVETLKAEVQAIDKETKALGLRLDEAAALRKKEREVFETSSKDRHLALKVLKQAKEVLQQFYATKDNSAGLVQQPQAAGSNPPPATWGHSSRKTIVASGALALLDRVAGDIQKEQQNSEAEEQRASSNFEKLQAETRAEFDRMMEEIAERNKQRGKLKVQLNTDKDSRVQVAKDLDAIKVQLTSLHKECDDTLKHFDERQKAREFELNQLKDVVDILHGSLVAARTGLLQRHPQELSLMQDLSPEEMVTVDKGAYRGKSLRSQ